MIDHVVLNVRDVEKSKTFYARAFAPLGAKLVTTFPDWAGFGREGKATFWIARREPFHTGVHVAIACDRRSAVDGFYDAAIGAGGKDNGKPGLRADYHADYYGAFVLDPDGNNIEAVAR
jgi:catechol 2,3-dioxygenase-like lactoylglutathione lyase family enzyme